MAIKFGKSEKFQNAKTALVDAIKDGDAGKQESAWSGFIDALKDDVQASVAREANDMMMDRSILQNRGQNVLTAEETKYFQAAIDKGGFDDESILPVTTQERVFEDIQNEHPFLNALGIQNAGAVTRIITSDPEYAFVWGKLFGPIEGQVRASFSEETITQLKGTAFAVIPNDMLELGPEWVERYVRAILVESVAIGLERGFLLGRGPASDEPIGLTKNVDPDTGAVSDKAPTGTLTFEPGRTTVRELKDVVKGLSRRIADDGTEKARRIAGRIVMVANPFDYFDIVAASTTQNASGVYVSNLPFNPTIVESEFVPEGQVLFFVRGEYLAYTAGGYRLKRFDQTLAMEDATLYTIKQFGVGKPKDNNAAAIYTLAIESGSSDPAGV